MEVEEREARRRTRTEALRIAIDNSPSPRGKHWEAPLARATVGTHKTFYMPYQPEMGMWQRAYWTEGNPYRGDGDGTIAREVGGPSPSISFYNGQGYVNGVHSMDATAESSHEHSSRRESTQRDSLQSPESEHHRMSRDSRFSGATDEGSTQEFADMVNGELIATKRASESLTNSGIVSSAYQHVEKTDGLVAVKPISRHCGEPGIAASPEQMFDTEADVHYSFALGGDDDDSDLELYEDAEEEVGKPNRLSCVEEEDELDLRSAAANGMTANGHGEDGNGEGGGQSVIDECELVAPVVKVARTAEIILSTVKSAQADIAEESAASLKQEIVLETSCEPGATIASPEPLTGPDAIKVQKEGYVPATESVLSLNLEGKTELFT